MINQYKKWTQREEQLLTKNHNILSYTELAERLGRSYESIKGKCRHLNLPHKRVYRRWKTSQIEQILELKRLGRSLEQIGTELGVSRNTIAGVVFRASHGICYKQEF